ncbi:hypothetical protein R1flu_018670 [Riccia fluitans]|uniref:EF-hand domain-containing protein n=1 Tax=Riccia fluitans TaxID=41844 RepID=A0ABD1ZHJ7_9MARC
MDEPLMESGGRAEHFRDDGRDSTFRGRRGALVGGDVYQRAAALVDLAEDGEGIPSEVLEQDNAKRSTSLYFTYIRLDPFWNLTLAALILLSFFEVPLWCSGSFPNPCGSREKYYLGSLPYLTREESLVFEIVIFIILVVYTFYPILFMGKKLFWRDSLNSVKVVLLLLLAVDTLVDLFYVTPTGPISSLPVRVAPYVRVILVAVNLSQVRDSVKTIFQVLPDFIDVAALLSLFILFSSWLGYILFEDTVQGKEVFTSYMLTLYGMTILFTTENNPDLWLPAYKQAPISSVFFILYILIGVYFMTNLVLAVIYDSFKGQLAEHFMQEEQRKDELLKITFNLLDQDERGYLDVKQCSALFRELNNYRTLPNIEEEDMEAVFYALDDSGDFKITLEEFTDICQAIALKFDKQEIPQWLEAFPTVYNSSSFQKIRQFVRSNYFEYIILGMLGLNLITVIIETTLDIENDASQQFWQEIELVFGWIYLIELALKVLVYGFSNYWRSGQNRFDFFVTWIIVIGETLTAVLPNGLPYFTSTEWIRYLLIARLLRLVRGLMLIERYRVKVVTFVNLIPNLLPYLGINFFLMCIYCTIGMQVFGGLVYEGNSKLEQTSMFENDYMVYNFNDYASGMVTLFNVLVMGNWQVWMETYGTLSKEWWAVAYFISFYVLGILLILNLVVAFVLEAFFAEIEINEESKARDADDAEGNSGISDPRYEKRRRARRGRDPRVQNLLSHMLSAEMEKNKGASSSSEI